MPRRPPSDGGHPGAGERKPDRVGGRSMRGRLAFEAGRPVRLADGKVPGEGRVPLAHQLAVGLEMELDAIGGAADPEGLCCR